MVYRWFISLSVYLFISKDNYVLSAITTIIACCHSLSRNGCGTRLYSNNTIVNLRRLCIHQFTDKRINLLTNNCIYLLFLNNSITFSIAIPPSNTEIKSPFLL
jgi:hypothetical protein